MNVEGFRDYLEEELPLDLGFYLDLLEVPWDDRASVVSLGFELFSKNAPIGLPKKNLSLASIMSSVNGDTPQEYLNDSNRRVLWSAGILVVDQLFKNQLVEIADDGLTFNFKYDVASLAKTFRLLAAFGEFGAASEKEINKYLHFAKIYSVRASL